LMMSSGSIDFLFLSSAKSLALQH
jgi:hypothetical protein